MSSAGRGQSLKDLKDDYSVIQAKYTNLTQIHEQQKIKLAQTDKRKEILQKIATKLQKNKSMLQSSLKEMENNQKRQQITIRNRLEEHNHTILHDIESVKQSYKPIKQKVKLIMARNEELLEQWSIKEQKIMTINSDLDAKMMMLNAKIEETQLNLKKLSPNSIPNQLHHQLAPIEIPVQDSADTLQPALNMDLNPMNQLPTNLTPSQFSVMTKDLDSLKIIVEKKKRALTDLKEECSKLQTQLKEVRKCETVKKLS